MGQVLIRNVPDTTIAIFKERAKRKGHSLEKEIRDLIEANRPYTSEERVMMSQHFRSLAKGASLQLTADEIREGLE
jgi:antitoxin FitA